MSNRKCWGRGALERERKEKARPWVGDRRSIMPVPWGVGWGSDSPARAACEVREWRPAVGGPRLPRKREEAVKECAPSAPRRVE